METSILRGTKKILGIDPDDETYDVDIITFINSALSAVQQLGVGVGFQVVDAVDQWDDFEPDPAQLNLVQTIVYLHVKMLFDPPATSFTQQALLRQLEELAWRLSVMRESTQWVDPDPPAISEEVA